jgi:alpha-beta hydrolase superfamily lysophospholipase
LEEWFPSTEVYRQARYDVFMLDYRGYGKSTGVIESEAQLHQDVRAAWDFVAKEYPGRKRVIYGRSLGTGLATMLAAQVDADLLVLVSPYFSIQDAARDHYPWVPSALLRYPMRTDLLLPRVKMPTLILHGDRDAVIGVNHAVRLLPLATRGELIRIPEAGHEDIHLSQRYLDALMRHLDALDGPPRSTEATKTP